MYFCCHCHCCFLLSQPDITIMVDLAWKQQISSFLPAAGTDGWTVYGLFLCDQDVRKIRNQRYKNVPMCQRTCDSWWEACKSDLTCTDNWTQNFNWSSGKYVFLTCKGLGGSVWWSLGARLGESVWRAWVEVCERLGESVLGPRWKCVKGWVEVS